jgi:uncharacterized metal-binding protein
MSNCCDSRSRPPVAILGCSGIGQLMSTVVRRACVRVADRHPEVVLLSVGALTGDVEEALDQGRKLPVVLVDGCREHCGTILCEAKGEDRSNLGEIGLAAVEDVARGIGAEIRRLQEELAAEEVA